LSDSRDRIKDIVDSLTDKVSDAKQRADNLQQSIQDVKYEEHDKLEAARMGY
jgi:FtsZ-binding cell division protein ZapB